MSINYDKLIQIYADLLGDNYPPQKAIMDDNLSEYHEQMCHLSYMLTILYDTTDENKLNRWLGFIQGVLWASHQQTIDQLRQHVI